jgi:competence protein ComFC
VFRTIINLIFPKFCLGCGKLGTHLCADCFETIDFYPFAWQPPLEKLSLEKIYVVAQYQGVIKKLITTLKYQSAQDIASTLAQLTYYTTNFPQTETITYVPLHQRRYRQRGFNQAAQIAFSLGKLTHTPVLKLIKRNKHSAPQAQTATKAQRLTRLKDTFSFNTDYNNFIAASVIIIDDVTTTGTTLNECAQVLKQAGWQKIFGLVIAHGN